MYLVYMVSSEQEHTGRSIHPHATRRQVTQSSGIAAPQGQGSALAMATLPAAQSATGTRPHSHDWRPPAPAIA